MTRKIFILITLLVLATAVTANAATTFTCGGSFENSNQYNASTTSYFDSGYDISTFCDTTNMPVYAPNALYSLEIAAADGIGFIDGVQEVTLYLGNATPVTLSKVNLTSNAFYVTVSGPLHVGFSKFSAVSSPIPVKVTVVQVYIP